MISYNLEEDKTLRIQKGTEVLYLSLEDLGSIILHLMDLGIYTGFLERMDKDWTGADLDPKIRLATLAKNQQMLDEMVEVRL